MKDPILSIIMCAYNAEDTIECTLNSVIASMDNDTELIIVNDGSKDATQSLVEKYKSKNVYIYKTENRGIAVSRNFAINKAKGKYITFVDADDIVDKDIYRKCKSIITENDSDIILFDYMTVNNQSCEGGGTACTTYSEKCYA